MQKLAGIITEAKTDVEKKQRLEALVDFFSQSGTGDEMRAIRNTYLHFKNNKDIETLEPVLKNRYLKSPGIFNFEGFTEDEFKEIVEKLAEIKDDESFLEAPSFNENEIKRRLKESKGFNVDDYPDEDDDLIDLNKAFKAAPDKLPYDKVLDIIKSYEDESILDDFKSEFPEGEDISKKDYSDFSIALIDDMSEVSYIQANWIGIFDDTVYEKAGLV